MSFLITLIIILLVWGFIIAPFIRLIRVSRQWQNMFKDARNRQGQQQQRRRPQQAPAQQKKKIDPTVGEYVEFTETTVSQTTSSPHNDTHTTTEQQITDVTWEDLPPER